MTVHPGDHSDGFRVEGTDVSNSITGANGEAAPANGFVKQVSPGSSKPLSPQAPWRGSQHVDFVDPICLMAQKMDLPPQNEMPLPKTSPGIGRQMTLGALSEGFNMSFGKPRILERTALRVDVVHPPPRQPSVRALPDAAPPEPSLSPCSTGPPPILAGVAGSGGLGALAGEGGRGDTTNSAATAAPKSLIDFEQRVSSEIEQMQQKLLELHHTGLAGYRSEYQSLKNKLSFTEQALARALKGNGSVDSAGSLEWCSRHAGRLPSRRRNKHRLATAPAMFDGLQDLVAPPGSPALSKRLSTNFRKSTQTPSDMCEVQATSLRAVSFHSREMPSWLERWETLSNELLNAAMGEEEEVLIDSESDANVDDHEVELHETWISCSAWESATKSPVHGRTATHGDEHSDCSVDGCRVGDVYKGKPGPFQRLVVHPDSFKACTWCCFGVILVIYDMVTVPVVLAFDLDTSIHPFLQFFQWAVPFFWSVDIFFNFCVGYHSSGVVEMRLYKVISNYLKSWFGLDLFVCMVDWLSILLSEGVADSKASQGLLLARGGKVVRVSKFVKLLKVIRLIKVDQTLSAAWDNLHSEHMIVAMQLSRLVVCILLLAHYIACGWHGVALIGGELFNHETWLTGHGVEGADQGYLYLVSLHWTLTQFTPSTNNISCFNALERMYSIIVIFFSILTFSSIVSSITAAMNKLRALNASRVKEERDVRDFLRRHRVSLRFERRIWAFFRQSYQTATKYTREDEIRFFVMLPEPLRLQLHTEMYCHFVKLNPAFYEAYKVDSALIHSVCHCALSERHVSRGTDVFGATSNAETAYLPRAGLLEYSAKFVDVEVVVDEEEWIAEGALWTHWFYMGTLTAAQNSTLLALDNKAFHRVVLQNRDSAAVRGLRKYGALFILHLHRLQNMKQGLTDLGTEMVELRKLAQRAFMSGGFMDTLSEPPRRVAS